MKTVPLSCYDEEIARYEIYEDGTAIELYLHDAFRPRFSEVFARGNERPPGSLLHVFNIAANASGVDKLKILFAQLATEILFAQLATESKQTTFVWPGETLKTYTIDELRAIQKRWWDNREWKRPKNPRANERHLDDH